MQVSSKFFSSINYMGVKPLLASVYIYFLPFKIILAHGDCFLLEDRDLPGSWNWKLALSLVY